MHQPSKAQIRDTRSRKEVVWFIEDKKKSGWESNCLFLADGLIEITLFSAENYKGKRKAIHGWARYENKSLPTPLFL